MPTSPDGILTVSFDPASAAVSILVDGSMWPSAVTEITVTRTPLGQPAVPVRGLENLRVEGGWYIGTDHEAPLDTDVKYEVTGYDQFGDVVATSWSGALASGTAKALVLGDSIAEGSATSTIGNRWQSIIQRRLSAAAPAFPFIPAAPGNATAGWPVTWAGTLSTSPEWGLGLRTRRLSDNTSTVTFTFTGTSARIVYLRTSSTGIMSIVLDGGAPVVVDTANASTINAATWSTGALTAGAHTITISRDPSTVAGRFVYIQGLQTYAGDETVGVRVLDAGHSGFSTANFVSGTRLTTQRAAIVTAGMPDLLVISLLNNDYAQSVAAATYKANIESIIAGVRTDGFVGTVLLVGMVRQHLANATTWQGYHDQLAAIAAADDAVVYLDLRRWMADVDDDTEGLWSVDGVHPNDAGHARIAQVIGDMITATSTQATVSTTGASWGVWLKAPGRADLTVLAQLRDRGEISSPTIGGTFQVHDGPEVAAWSGVGGDRVTLQLQTRSTAQAAAVRSLLKQARVLLVQTGQPADIGDGTGSDWWFVENASQGNPQRYTPSGDYALRYHTLQLVRTTVPAGEGIAYTGQTYSTVLAEFATYQDIADDVATYADLMTGGA